MQLGRRGEHLAAKYLENLGYDIYARNYRTKMGEIDLIAVDKNTLVFCEVKTRNSTTFGQPFESVTQKKQATIQKIAEYFIAVNRINFTGISEIRFDVVSILRKGDKMEIEHFKNAF
jgi:putative endonuclease